jgi:hypothetical protein
MKLLNGNEYGKNKVNENLNATIPDCDGSKATG